MRKDIAAEIRKKLKALGWNRRQVSVRNRSGGYSTAIHIKIKDATVPKHKVEEVANGYEDYERCPASQEILSGGNTFVFVDYEYGLLTAKAAELLPLLSDEPGIPVDIEGVSVWREKGGYIPGAYSLCKVGGDLNTNQRADDKQEAARTLATILMDGGFENYGEWVAV